MERNDVNEPVFELDSKLKVTRADSSLYLTQFLGNGSIEHPDKEGINIPFDLSVGLQGDLHINVEGKRYKVAMSGVVASVLGNALKNWNQVEQLNRPTKETT